MVQAVFVDIGEGNYENLFQYQLELEMRLERDLKQYSVDCKVINLAPSRNYDSAKYNLIMKPKKILIVFIFLMIISVFVHNTISFAGVFPKKDWEKASPESQSIDSKKMKEALNYLKSISGKNGISETMVIRHGYLIWHGDSIDNLHNVWSCTKSFSSIALGLLIDDGKCTLKTLAKDIIPDLGKHYPTLTLRHFTTLTSGYEGVSKTKPFKSVTSLFESGKRFHYGDASMNQFANVLTRIAGEPIKKLFKRRIADPIGMKKWFWGDFGKVDGLIVNGGSGSQSKGIHISAREMARFGLLLLNQGNWDGKQLISAEWVEQATSPQVDKDLPPFKKKGWYTSILGAYGYNFWTNGIRPDGKRMWPDAPVRVAAIQGNYNNFCFIVPEWDMVIVRMGTDKRINNDLYSNFFSRLKLSIKDKNKTIDA